jgi:aspartate carbamoyltransferase catalytic subunit
MPLPFPHRHLLGIEQLSAADISVILRLAERYVSQNRSAQRNNSRLAGKTVVNMFFENSTRTRTSFEIAAKRLGAEVVNFSADVSSVRKGETFLDTVRVINAMQVDAFVIRHPENGAPASVVPYVNASVLNAGDGSHEHPTQALLDALTIKKHKGRLEGLKVAICGDIEHSRVARSNIDLLKKFGSEVRLFAPPMFMPRDLKQLGVTAYDNMADALNGVDVVIILRIQNERLAQGEFAMPVEEYHKRYGFDHAKLKVAKPDVIVMHPLPMNRGVEITDELADDPKFSFIFQQIEHGVAVRMACLDLLVGGG